MITSTLKTKDIPTGKYGNQFWTPTNQDGTPKETIERTLLTFANGDKVIAYDPKRYNEGEEYIYETKGTMFADAKLVKSIKKAFKLAPKSAYLGGVDNDRQISIEAQNCNTNATNLVIAMKLDKDININLANIKKAQQEMYNNLQEIKNGDNK